VTTVTLPLVGTVERRYVYVGGAVVVVIVGYAYLRHRRSGGSEVVVDEATGSVGADGSFVNPNPNASGADSETVNPDGAILDNASWTHAVLADFDSMGTYDPLFAAEALGKYLGGQPLTQDEARLVRAAIALEGKPPQGSLEIILTTTGSTTGGTSNPPPVPTPKPPASTSSGVKYQQTAKFTTSNPPWNSTLSGIAGHYGTSVDHLMALNVGNPDVVNRNLIKYPGRVRYQ